MRNGANHSKHDKCTVTCTNLSHVYMRDVKCSGVRVLDTTRLRKCACNEVCRLKSQHKRAKVSERYVHAIWNMRR